MQKADLVDFDPATGRVAHSPHLVYLESSSRCNLKCVHCFTDFGSPHRPPAVDMPVEMVDRLAPWIEGARFLNLNGVGEPLYSRSFDRILDICTRARAEVSFNTNGVLLTSARCERIVASGVSSVAVSIDGVATHCAVRGVPYEFIRENLLRLAAAKKRVGASKPRIAVAFTLMKRNLAELPELMNDLLPRNVLDSVHVQPLIVMYEGMRDQNPYLAPEAESVLGSCRQIADRHGANLNIYRSNFQADERNRRDEPAPVQTGSPCERFGCVDPFFEIHVRADGGINSCCYGQSPGLNVMDTELEGIWNGSWYRELRLSLLSKRFVGRCGSCPLVFGSAENQTRDLVTGRRHSRDRRFQAAKVRNKN